MIPVIASAALAASRARKGAPRAEQAKPSRPADATPNAREQGSKTEPGKGKK